MAIASYFESLLGQDTPETYDRICKSLNMRDELDAFEVELSPRERLGIQQRSPAEDFESDFSI